MVTDVCANELLSVHEQTVGACDSNESNVQDGTMGESISDQHDDLEGAILSEHLGANGVQGSSSNGQNVCVPYILTGLYKQLGMALCC